jgi:protein TonB
MKYLLHFLLMLPLASLAQQTPAPTTEKQPIVLRSNRMQVQAKPAANRPDKAPVFPGGAPALGVFFQQYAKYPDAARVKGVNGNVLLTALVNPDGTLSDLKVAQSLSPECDAEALKAAAQLPPWQPATRRGVPVPCLIQLPVPFGNANVLKVQK